jgi:hypothetical protein
LAANQHEQPLKAANVTLGNSPNVNVTLEASKVPVNVTDNLPESIPVLDAELRLFEGYLNELLGTMLD